MNAAAAPTEVREGITTAVIVVGALIMCAGLVGGIRLLEVGGAASAVLAALALPVAIWLDYQSCQCPEHDIDQGDLDEEL